MAANGSLNPQFESDDSTYVLVTLTALSADTIKQATNQVTNQATNQAGRTAIEILETEIHNKVKTVLVLVSEWRKRKEILDSIELSNQTFNRKKFLDPLTALGWIEMKHPSNESHPDQAYRLSESGRKFLNLITEK